MGLIKIMTDKVTSSISTCGDVCSISRSNGLQGNDFFKYLFVVPDEYRLTFIKVSIAF